MSQDLLAEFGDFTLKEGTTQNNTEPSLINSNHNPNLGSSGTKGQQAQGDDFWDGGDDDDDFGDFEEPEPAPSVQTTVKQATHIKEPTKETKNTAPLQKPSGPPVTTKKASSASQLSSSHPFAANPDLLFDADEYDEFEDADVVGSWGDEDDFGDFETSDAPAKGHGTPQPTAPPSRPKTVKPPAPAAPSAAVDLLGLDDPPETTSRARPPPSPQVAPKKATPAPKAPANRPAIVPRQESVLSNDDAWDDFETSRPSPPPPQPAIAEEAPEIDLPKDILGDLTALPSTTGVAPSNIPPPSVLLTIFPPVLTSLSQQFLHPLSTLSPAQKSLFLCTAETKSFLASYITLTHILAHVIAGRKSRWKRDKHLAQSMRIGPAMSGRSGGMKLTGLDRSEAGREDTEVEVVLGVWREQVGRLKLAATAASASGARLAVPELAAVMPVRAAKASEGAIVSTQSCALCGLKREERVAKVDVAVEDSFGEWWIEGTNMHTACARFWELFKTRLMSR